MGDLVNLETDMLAKYVQRQLTYDVQAEALGGRVNSLFQ